jgi:ABC-type transport system involved in multi-copper enzyme maturation permease subunit
MGHVWSLIWKEWHEQWWKLGFSSVVLGALALIGLRARIVPDESMVIMLGFLGMALLPILTAAGLVAPERSQGSLEGLLALPVRPWKILLAKTLAGIVLCAGPMCVAAAVSLLSAGGHEITTVAMVDLFARFLLADLGLFIWMFALTIRLPTETRAALIAIGVLVLWILVTVALSSSGVSSLVLHMSPMGSFVRDPRELASPLVVYNLHYWLFGFHSAAFSTLGHAILLQCAIGIGLWIWALLQLTRVTKEK